jgi:hypothetical protein
LGQAEIDQREDAARRAAAGGAQEPWMGWIAAYHRLLRTALWLKANRLTVEDSQGILAEVRRLSGLPLSPAFVSAVLAPPQRRIGPVIIAAVAEAFAIDPRTIARTLFPVRRPSPYTLD